MPWKEIDVKNQRTEFVMRALKAENFRALCMEYGISAKTGYKWLERFKEHGRVGLADESRRPRSHAKALSEEVVCEIVRLKKLKPDWGPSKIRSVYARLNEEVPSESSFKRVLDRAGWVERRPRAKREASGRIFQGRKAEKANDVWTVDFKGWWYGSNRKRCEPLTVRDEFSRYVLELRSSALPSMAPRLEQLEQTIANHEREIAELKDRLIATVLDNAITDSRILPAERMRWRAELLENFELASRSLANAKPKITLLARSDALAPRPAPATYDARQNQILTLVNQRIQTTGATYHQAWLLTKHEHPHLFQTTAD